MLVLKVKNLNKNFDKIQAVKDVSFSIKQGEIVALLGPNGAGKSTLMNMIAGFISPSSGQIQIMEKDIKGASSAYKQNIGFLPEGAPLYSDLTVKQFLFYLSGLKGTDTKEIDRAVQAASLEQVLNQRIETLSKGYQRRVGFAQSILNNPPLLLLDEPTDGLDPNQKDYIRNLIKEMSKKQTFLISTHLLEEAETLADRIILMDKGTIRADGTKADILKAGRASSLHDAFQNLTTGTEHV